MNYESESFTAALGSETDHIVDVILGYGGWTGAKSELVEAIEAGMQRDQMSSIESWVGAR